MGRRKHFVSVGTKLTSAMLLVLCVVTAVAYFQVSRHEREQLLSAKERSAAMVTELFAAGVTATLSFGDDKGVREQIALLTANTNVVYAAVWRVDGGTRGEKLGETARRAVVPQPAPEIPERPLVRRTADSVSVQESVVSASGEILGDVLVEFSLLQENAAIAAAQRSTLAMSLATGLGLAIVLLALTRTVVVRRLAQLAKAAKRLENGEVADITFDTNDEVGALSRAFASMGQAIAHREFQVFERNRDLRRVLDNVAEGLMTVGKDGTMPAERSRAIDEWFGSPAPGATIFDYFASFAPATAGFLRLGWTALQDDIMPVAVILDQIRGRFELRSRTFELDYSPIWSGAEEDQVLDQVLVVVRDVTATVERERAEQSQRDALHMFRRILIDPGGFHEFLRNASRLVEAIEQSVVGQRTGSHVEHDIHTLKGDTAVYGIESIATICHAIESRMQESRAPLTADEAATLRAAWNRVHAMASELENGTALDRIEIRADEYERHLAQIQAGSSKEALALTVRSWSNELAERSMQRIADQGRALARRLGKGSTAIDARVTPSSLRLSAALWAPVWSAFSHVLRNAFDHGIESEEERLAANKPPEGRVEITLKGSRYGVELRVVDDGRGIDWESVRERARQLGVPHRTQEDLEEALFTDNLTTRSSATEISGRGLGMGAVRDAVRSCGGTISIESRLGFGTTLTLRFPSAMNDAPMRSFAPSIAPKAAC
ncbi:MAG: ATP-binding protein [Myxococcota bacterium]|nr:ATP-binding protein [Myxococcota bacterium]